MQSVNPGHCDLKNRKIAPSCDSYLNALKFVASNILCILIYALFSMHCILCSVKYALYAMQYKECIVYYASYSMHCLLCNVFYALYSMY